MHFHGHREGHDRGQALVEFAVILPILALLLLMTIDFGRVFFGWVNLQNASRIGANYASTNPTDTNWGAGSDYWQVIDEDTGFLDPDPRINCDLTDPDPPDFTAGTKDVGDPVTVELECDFTLITPLMDNLMGGDIQLGASSTFAIRTGMVGGVGGGGGGGGGGGIERTVPDLVGMSLADARKAWTTAGFLGTFTPGSGQDSKLVTAPQFPTPGTVTAPTETVTVTSTNPPSCSGSNALLPKLIGLTVADARTSWAARGFTASNFTPSSGAGDQVVTDQTADPAATWGTCVPNTTELEVVFEAPPAALCFVPSLVGKQASNAQSVWAGANFATTVQFDPAGFNGKVGNQSIVQGAIAECETTVITVYK